MSFAAEVKNELAHAEPEKKCCQLSEIAGFLRVTGSLRLAGGGKFRIVITTENPAVARYYKKLIQDYFGIETALEIGEGEAVGRKRSYHITIDPENRSEQILRETGILLVREGNNYISDGIYFGVVKSKCCKKSYLKGLFLGAGTMSNPAKGYHLEFVCGSEVLANDLRKLINSFVDLNARIVKRKNSYIVYMKKADYISDVLSLIGAYNKVLEMENIRIGKEMVSDAKRIANCDSANLDRVVSASMKHIEAIKKIERTKGLEILPPKLLETARIRLENPYLNITQLGELFDPPLKKSGINNRLKKIEEIASHIEE